VKSVVESDFPFPGVNHFERLPGARSTHVTRVKEGVGLFTHAHGPTVSHLRKALFIRTPETYHLPDKRHGRGVMRVGRGGVMVLIRFGNGNRVRVRIGHRIRKGDLCMNSAHFTISSAFIGTISVCALMSLAEAISDVDPALCTH